MFRHTLHLLATLTCVGVASYAPAPPAPAEEGVAATIDAADDSLVLVTLLDKKLELVTEFGTLQVPVARIKRIDFADRVPSDVATAAAKHVANLNHADQKVRDGATEALKQLKGVGYRYALPALKSSDPEVARRAEEVVARARLKLPASRLEVREFDVVHTADAKLVGHLTGDALLTASDTFGEQPVKFGKVRTLRLRRAVEEAEAKAPMAPGNMTVHAQQFGKEYVYTVTGLTSVPGASVSLWGTDQYSLDSQIAAAVVHAGIAAPGETVEVKVRIIQSPAQFVGTFRNNVSSVAYSTPFAGGAYELSK